jgi:hypothetical protein
MGNSHNYYTLSIAIYLLRRKFKQSIRRKKNNFFKIVYLFIFTNIYFLLLIPLSFILFLFTQLLTKFIHYENKFTDVYGLYGLNCLAGG